MRLAADAARRPRRYRQHMAAVRAFLARPIAGLPLGDVLLALVCAVETQLDAWLGSGQPTPRLPHALLALAATLPLAIRRRAPLVAGSIVMAAMTADVLLAGHPLGSPGATVGFYGSLYSVGAYSPVVPALVWLVAASLAIDLAYALDQPFGWNEAF